MFLCALSFIVSAVIQLKIASSHPTPLPSPSLALVLMCCAPLPHSLHHHTLHYSIIVLRHYCNIALPYYCIAQLLHYSSMQYRVVNVLNEPINVTLSNAGVGVSETITVFDESSFQDIQPLLYDVLINGMPALS